MKISIFSLSCTFIWSALLMSQTDAQVLSAKRLTQRIAPQTAPAQPTVARPAALTPAPVQVVPGTVPPAKSLAEAEAPTEKALPKPTDDQDNSELPAKPAKPPISVECKHFEVNPRESLQYLQLLLNNHSTNTISRLTLRLVYCDAQGLPLKDWITRRELDQCLPGDKSLELRQPAYFMPLITKKVQIELRAVRFADGKEWERR